MSLQTVRGLGRFIGLCYMSTAASVMHILCALFCIPMICMCVAFKRLPQTTNTQHITRRHLKTGDREECDALVRYEPVPSHSLTLRPDTQMPS